MFGRPQTAYGHTKHEQISGSAKGIDHCGWEDVLFGFGDH